MCILAPTMGQDHEPSVCFTGTKVLLRTHRDPGSSASADSRSAFQSAKSRRRSKNVLETGGFDHHVPGLAWPLEEESFHA